MSDLLDTDIPDPEEAALEDIPSWEFVGDLEMLVTVRGIAILYGRTVALRFPDKFTMTLSGEDLKKRAEGALSKRPWKSSWERLGADEEEIPTKPPPAPEPPLEPRVPVRHANLPIIPIGLGLDVDPWEDPDG